MGIGDTTLPDELTDDPDDFTHDYAACQDPICALRPLRSLWRWIHRWQREGLLRGPHLVPEGTRSLLRVQPVYGREIGAE